MQKLPNIMEFQLFTCEDLCLSYYFIVKLKLLGVWFSSVGRARVPCTEALSSLQRPWVRPFAVCHSPSLSSCFLSHPQLFYPKENF